MEGIIGFSTAPLAMSSVLGLLFCFISFLAIVYIIIKTLIWGDPTSGWPSLACLVLMIGGIQLFCMGILGQYLGKAYIEVKNRPIYLASKVEVEDEEQRRI
jgi:glycosyltransferase involved in cell wall biosynthesis